MKTSLKTLSLSALSLLNGSNGLRPVLAALALLAIPAFALADGGPPGPRFRPVPPKSIANLAPTAQGRLEAAQRSLSDALAALARATGSKGPKLDQAVADATAAQALVADALVWLKAHPEANALPPGPAPAESPVARPATVPAGNQVPGINLLAAVEALNTALGNFLNNPDPAAKTPVLGPLGGHREKIMAAIGRANDDVLSLIRSPAVSPVGTPVAQAGLATSPVPVPGPMAASAAQDNVVLPTVPAEAESVAKAYVDMTYSRPRPTLSVPKDTVKIGLVLPYYSVTATSQALPTEPTGHYYCLIESAGSPIAYLSLVKLEANQPMRVQGGFAVSGPESMPNAVARARAAMKDKPGKYEIRIISYGAQRNAIWLKAIGNGSDYVYAIGGDTEFGLKSTSLYSGDDFLSLVLPVLKDLAARPRTRGGGSNETLPSNSTRSSASSKLATKTSPISPWKDTTIKLIIPGKSGSPTVKSQTVDLPAKIAEYIKGRSIVAAYVPTAHKAVVMPAGFAMNQRFYVSDTSGLFLCSLTAAGGLVWQESYVEVAAANAADIEQAIARFESSFSASQIDELAMYGSGKSVTLTPAHDPWFFMAGVGASNQGKGVHIDSISVEDGILQLDLTSPVTKHTASYWIDLVAGKVVRATNDGKPADPGPFSSHTLNRDGSWTGNR